MTPLKEHLDEARAYLNVILISLPVLRSMLRVSGHLHQRTLRPFAEQAKQAVKRGLFLTVLKVVQAGREYVREIHPVLRL
jgi:hypothetical protein